MQIYNSKQDLWFMAWEKWNPVKRYTEEYQERAATTNYYNPEVFRLRKNWVTSNCDINQSFDYGCGMKPFHYDFETNTSPCKGLWDMYTDPFTKFDRTSFLNSKTLLLFDVLEHIYDPHSFLLTLPQRRLLMTIPVHPKEKLNSIEDIEGWKHTRPGEHFIYANEAGIVDIVTNAGWKVSDKGFWECPPREDILSLVLVRE
jgi:hypothetical protein